MTTTDFMFGKYNGFVSKTQPPSQALPYLVGKTLVGPDDVTPIFWG